MTKLLNASLFRLLVIGFLSICLASCNGDDDNPAMAPVKIQDLNGNYSGKTAITQGNKKSQTDALFTVKSTEKDGIITMNDFPVKEIVNSVISDPAKATAAINTIGKVKYDLNFISQLQTNKTQIHLAFQPKVLDLTVPVDGVNKNVKVTFTATKGIYTGKSKSLNFDITATKITVDGTVPSPYQNILYNFPNFIKK